jgi:hypothetical protein
METYENAVFISYAWGEEREQIVNEIDKSLQARGLKIVRDKRALEYKGSIKKFMERIGRGDCVIVVVSDKYLKSPNCMYELVEIAENKDFEKRIFPVVLADADIYKTTKQIDYIKYWEDQIRELKEKIATVDQTHLEGPHEQLNLYDRIRDNISRLTVILSDMNTLTPDMHRESDFDELYDAIEEKMKESVQEESVVERKGEERQGGREQNPSTVIGHVQGHVIDRPSGPIHIGDNITAQEIVHGDKIQVGNISNSTGVAIGRGAQAKVEQHSGMSAEEIAKIFSMLQQYVEKMPPGDEKNETKDALEKLQKEANKGDAADESRVQKYLNFLADTAPDIWEVAVDTFINPIKGISTIFCKVAERARKSRS